MFAGPSSGPPNPFNPASTSDDRREAVYGPQKKRRRIHLNCEECRRTKSKCNRSWPCSECVRKGLGHICPNKVAKSDPPKAKTIAQLTGRIEALEEIIRRHGLESETLPPDEEETNTLTQASDFPTSRAVEMTAALAKMTLGNGSSKRYAGTEAWALYLSSPSDSEDEEAESVLGGSPVTEGGGTARIEPEAPQLPWARSEGLTLGGRGNLPGALMDRCRALLPTRKAAKEMFERFWSATSWRLRPMTRSYFLHTIIPNIYDSPSGAHAHELALFFATQAVSMLFDPARPTHNGRLTSFTANDYHETSYACLVAGRFYTETTLSSLIALHLLGSFMINSDDRRSPDGIFTVIGLAVRSAIIAGYHRDPKPGSMSAEDADMRRRIWFELLAVERVHCMPTVTPLSIFSSQYDTHFPFDEDPGGFFVYKWKLGMEMSRVIEFWTSRSRSSDPQKIDLSLKRLLGSLPVHLRCRELPADAFDVGTARSPPLPPHNGISNASHDLLAQQYRLASHFCMVFFYLHRPYFMQSLASGTHESDSSVRTVMTACARMVGLIAAVLRLNSDMSRWFSFSADLFTILHCQTAVIIKTKDPQRFDSRVDVLTRGVGILEETAKARPSSKNRALLQGGRRLLSTARASRSTAATHVAAQGDSSWSLDWAVDPVGQESAIASEPPDLNLDWSNLLSPDDLPVESQSFEEWLQEFIGTGQMVQAPYSNGSCGAQAAHQA